MPAIELMAGVIMKLRVFTVAVTLLVALGPAQGKSFKSASPRWLAENVLAWATPIQLNCSPTFFVRHSIYDLVWDIYELKSGGSIEDNADDLAALNEATERLQADFGKTWDCRSAYKNFGESGQILRGVMYPANLDKTLSNPF
nr:hypothetical protein [Brucella intermedia]